MTTINSSKAAQKKQAQCAAEVPTVVLTLTLEQSYVVAKALDVYTRLCIGQLDIIPELIRDATIPLKEDIEKPRKEAPMDVIDTVDIYINMIKEKLGYPSNGSNGIGHKHVDKSGHRAWEIKKTLSKALANYRDPNPSMRGVDYDGVIVRYTNDDLPVAEVKAPPSPLKPKTITSPSF
jgi:hypothetical protein